MSKKEKELTNTESLVTEEELVKTTTRKVKRNVEMEKIKM